MKIVAIKLKNFRAYKDEIVIPFDDLTVFVGKNDIGKSTVLEALDIFFEGGVVKLTKDDINKDGLSSGDNNIEISVIFNDFPEELVIDSTNPTRLSDEYLLNNDGLLEIVKRYSNAGKAKVFIKALHPTNDICNDLLSKK